MSKTVIKCPFCSQSLRIKIDKIYKHHCPSCNNHFYYNPDTEKITKNNPLDNQDSQDNIESQIISACEDGDLDIVKNLIEQDIDIDLKDEEGNSLLMLACTSGNKDLIKFLLDKGADINTPNNEMETPLNVAINSSNEIANNKNNRKMPHVIL